MVVLLLFSLILIQKWRENTLDQSPAVCFSLVKERGNCTLIEIIHTAEAHFITGLVSGEKAQNRALVYFCHAMLRLYSRCRSMVMDV